MWLFEDKEFEPDNLDDYQGFVYMLTDTVTGKRYIGKKFFWSTKKLPPLKGKKRKRTVKSQSDWLTYCSSNNEIKAIVEKEGLSRFKREILKLCKTKGECTYWESKLQFQYDVLLDDTFYNDFIMCRIQGSHVKNLK